MPNLQWTHHVIFFKPNIFQEAFRVASVGFHSIQCGRTRAGPVRRYTWFCNRTTVKGFYLRIPIYFNMRSNRKWFLCLFTSPDRMKRITFSVYALFPLSSGTEPRPVSFWGNPRLREKSRNYFSVVGGCPLHLQSVTCVGQPDVKGDAHIQEWDMVRG